MDQLTKEALLESATMRILELEAQVEERIRQLATLNGLYQDAIAENKRLKKELENITINLDLYKFEGGG